MNTMISTFQLVNNREPISPWLVTIKEYGRFMMDYFDPVITNMELFKQESKNGEPLRVYHPGSRMGKYFDTNNFSSPELISWFFKSGSSVLPKLYKYNLAESTDLNYVILGGDKERALRVYTPRMLELYIRTIIDPDFYIGNLLIPPKQITIQDSDLKLIVKPDIKKRTKLF